MAKIIPPIQGVQKHFLSKPLVFFTHFVCLALLFLLPEVLVSFDPTDNHHIEAGPYVKAAILVAVFYASYYLTPNPATRRRADITRFVIGNIVIVILAIIATEVEWHYLGPEAPWRETVPDAHIARLPHGDMPLHAALRDIVMIILTIALSVAIKLIDNFREVEQLRGEIAEREREAELKQLKSQLNPHFLFNTLNSIYVLIDLAPAKAQQSIHQLSRMLRYMLYENQGSVKLRDEIEFIIHYVELMRLRMLPSTELRFNVDANACMSLPIAPLIFINIIENTFKYGMRASEPSPIEIDIRCDGSVITLYTSNKYEPSPRDPNSGIGMSNLKRRLDIQYNKRHTLEVKIGDRFEVTLAIDLQRPPDIMPTSADPSGQ